MIPAKIKESNNMQQFKRHWTPNACLIKFNMSNWYQRMNWVPADKL